MIQTESPVDFLKYGGAEATLQRPDVEKAKAVFAEGKTATEERNETESGEFCKKII